MRDTLSVCVCVDVRAWYLCSSMFPLSSTSYFFFLAERKAVVPVAFSA